jgi:hypothetical protein
MIGASVTLVDPVFGAPDVSLRLGLASASIVSVLAILAVDRIAKTWAANGPVPGPTGDVRPVEAVPRRRSRPIVPANPRESPKTTTLFPDPFVVAGPRQKSGRGARDDISIPSDRWRR